MPWRNIPICDECWQERCEERNEPDREPVRVPEAEQERCGFCGEQTSSGIFVREHTDVARFFVE